MRDRGDWRELVHFRSAGSQAVSRPPDAPRDGVKMQFALRPLGSIVEALQTSSDWSLVSCKQITEGGGEGQESFTHHICLDRSSLGHSTR